MIIYKTGPGSPLIKTFDSNAIPVDFATESIYFLYLIYYFEEEM